MRCVSDQKIFFVSHGKALGTNGGGDHGNAHGHGLIDFDARAATSFEWDDNHITIMNMWLHIIDGAGDFNLRIGLCHLA